ncbi:hypothetical protein J4H86_13270 [Spiractinospora alimapuensis]|uniref:hypothetical protein n=1 Tax=Spiractinospora alimapuensis TaxID=2820884 RepID=UPI001F176EBA|nr:hypothetical protein [Spiractinospora alimapuensis]QVQ54541.1 hypothetical protein J4H86_13270 [Spiractinospora alimapuensis]
METDGQSPDDTPPTPKDAAAALTSIEETRSAVARVRTPLWYFVTLGAMTAPIGPLSTVAPSSLPGALAFLGVMVAWLLALGWLMSRVVYRMGVQGRMTWKQLVLVPTACGLAGIAAAVLKNQFEVEWAMSAFTVVLGLVIVGVGLVHNHRKSQ